MTATNLAGDSGSSNTVLAWVKLSKGTMLWTLTQPDTASFNSWWYGKNLGGAPYIEYYFNWADDDCSMPTWVPKHIRDKLPYREEFRAGCERHDFGYRNYNGFQVCRSYKWAIDFMFLKDLLRICNQKSHWWSRLYCRNWASDYYYAVTAFAWGACH